MYYGPYDKLCSPSVLTEKEEMQKHLKILGHTEVKKKKKKRMNRIPLRHSYDGATLHSG